MVGYGITNIRSSSGTAHTIYTSIDHGLSGITSVSIVSGGSAYGSGLSATLYNARLVGFAGSTTGSNATARIVIDGSGVITGVNIIDGGSAYGIGNTLTVVGVATTTSHVVGIVRVETISDNVGDTLKISGVSSETYSVSGLMKAKGDTLPDCCLSALVRFHCCQGVSMRLLYRRYVVLSIPHIANFGVVN